MSAAVATQRVKERRAREYETIFILRPTTDPDEADRIAAKVTEIITTRGGKIFKLDNWGKRKLAYPINKTSRGIFVFVKFGGYEDVVAELERNLRLFDAVVRFQTVLNNPKIDLGGVAVDPEDTKFRRLEVTEDEAEPEIAQRLGLVDRPRPQRSEGDGDDDMARDTGYPDADDGFAGVGDDAVEDGDIV
jgi:small subunit ribosomal protein S6